MAWNDIRGQDFAKRLWQVHLATGRVAPAYLLAGPDGVGKRRLALELAKALNCEAPSAAGACTTCRTCAQIDQGIHPDVHCLVPEGASEQIKIEQIRQLLGRIALRPFNAAVQVAIIDRAERLTEEAANSLLKALEEPPVHTRFVLTTSRLSHCLPTIVSRCQRVRCRGLPQEAIARLLVETQGCEPSVAEAVARLSGGSASRAIELSGRWTTYQAAVARLASASQTQWIEDPLPEHRAEVAHLLEAMVGWLRDLAVTASLQPSSRAAEAAPAVHLEHREALARQARTLDVDRGLRTAFELVALHESLEQFVSPRLVAALAREKWLSLLE